MKQQQQQGSQQPGGKNQQSGQAQGKAVNGKAQLQQMPVVAYVPMPAFPPYGYPSEWPPPGMAQHLNSGVPSPYWTGGPPPAASGTAMHQAQQTEWSGSGEFSQAIKKRPEVSVQPYTWQPAVDLFEYPTYWLIQVEVPGADEDELSITWEERTLLVEGELHARDLQRAYHVERRMGSFARRVHIPEQVDAENTEATYRHGILEILIPKPGRR